MVKRVVVKVIFLTFLSIFYGKLLDLSFLVVKIKTYFLFKANKKITKIEKNNQKGFTKSIISVIMKT